MLCAQARLTLCDPMDCSPPGSSVHGILQAKILEEVARPCPRGSSQPRDQTWVFYIAGRFLTTEPPGKPSDLIMLDKRLSKYRHIGIFYILQYLGRTEHNFDDSPYVSVQR